MSKTLSSFVAISALAGAGVVVTACSSSSGGNTPDGGGGIGGSFAGSAGTAGTAGTTGAGGSGPVCGSVTCRALEECGTLKATGTKLCVSKSIAVTGGYTIDATETTYSQYQTWLATTPNLSSLPSYCTANSEGGVWKTSFNSGSGASNLPVVNVDWCDAYGYCAGIGKRLCGKLGGGSVDYTSGYDDITQSQWYSACVSGSAGNTYPYGNTYSGTTCNGYDNGAGATVPVGSMPGCTSAATGFTGTFDLSGNVYEWEDSCNGTSGANDPCRVRGGSFGDHDHGLMCGFDLDDSRNYLYVSIGFRCCGS